MLPISFAAILFTFGLSAFLSTSFQGFKDYQESVSAYSNWHETSLAASKRVALESSEFVLSVKTKVNDCLREYEALETNELRESFVCAVEFGEDVERLQASLAKDSTNVLNSTINYGLHYQKQDLELKNYDYELFYLEKFPVAHQVGDDLYNSTFVDLEKNILQQPVELASYDAFLQNGKLKLSSGFLEFLVGADNAKLIKEDAGKFALVLDEGAFAFDKLANAIVLSINFEKLDKDDLATSKIASVSQFKIQSQDSVFLQEIEDPIVVCTECFCDSKYCSDPNDDGGASIISTPADRFVQNTITFSQFDYLNARGIYFDNTQPASAQNQINLVNTQQGRFTSLYPGSDNYLQVSIGKLAQSSSVLIKNINAYSRLSTAALKKLDFASITFSPSHAELAASENYIIEQGYNINVDIIPRARKRYMTAQKDFIVNGRLITKGSVLVATLEPNSSLVNPQLNDFSTIRVYDKDDGSLKQIFKPGQRDSKDCANRACMDITEFDTKAANLSLPGSQLLQSFSTKDLFVGKSSSEANRLFTVVQKDLEINSVTGIYAQNYDWQKILISRDLNTQENFLLTEIFDGYASLNQTNVFSIANLLGLEYISSNDVFKNVIQMRMITAFVEFAKLKSEGQKAGTKKNEFLAYRELYQDYIKAKINSDNAYNRLFSLDLDYSNVDSDTYPEEAENTIAIAINSINTNSNRGNVPPLPIKPDCMKKKPKDRSNKCKANIARYKNLMKKHTKNYG